LHKESLNEGSVICSSVQLFHNNTYKTCDSMITLFHECQTEALQTLWSTKQVMGSELVMRSKLVMWCDHLFS